MDVQDAAAAGAVRINDYAMILHELTTNSAKYKALSGGGTLRERGASTAGTPG